VTLPGRRKTGRETLPEGGLPLKAIPLGSRRKAVPLDSLTEAVPRNRVSPKP